MVKPDEICNCAVQSLELVSFDSPRYTAEVDVVGELPNLEAVRTCYTDDTCGIYQASTSELYGKVKKHT